MAVMTMRALWCLIQEYIVTSGVKPNASVILFYSPELLVLLPFPFVSCCFYSASWVGFPLCNLFLPLFPSCCLLIPLPPSFLLSRCPFPSERQARLEAVREVFLAAYSSTVGLKSSAPSPSGAISGLLEQFARGVGLRATNAIVWTPFNVISYPRPCFHPSIHPSIYLQLIQYVLSQNNKVPNISVQFRGEAWSFLWIYFCFQTLNALDVTYLWIFNHPCSI